MIEPLRGVLLDARSEHSRFPSRRRQFVAVEQFEDGLDSSGSFGVVLAANALPPEQETLKFCERDRLNLGAQSVDRETMYPCQQPAIAPFEIGSASAEFPAQHEAFGFQRQQGRLYFLERQLEEFGQDRCGGRAGGLQPTPQQLAHGLGPIPMALRFRRWRNQVRLDGSLRINRLHHRQPFGGQPKTLAGRGPKPESARSFVYGQGIQEGDRVCGAAWTFVFSQKAQQQQRLV
jgi:hypothetical protein